MAGLSVAVDSFASLPAEAREDSIEQLPITVAVAAEDLVSARGTMAAGPAEAATIGVAAAAELASGAEQSMGSA